MRLQESTDRFLEKLVPAAKPTAFDQRVDSTVQRIGDCCFNGFHRLCRVCPRTTFDCALIVRAGGRIGESPGLAIQPQGVTLCPELFFTSPPPAPPPSTPTCFRAPSRPPLLRHPDAPASGWRSDERLAGNVLLSRNVLPTLLVPSAPRRGGVWATLIVLRLPPRVRKPQLPPLPPPQPESPACPCKFARTCPSCGRAADECRG